MTSLPNISRRLSLTNRFAFLARWFRRQNHDTCRDQYRFDGSKDSSDPDADPVGDPHAFSDGNGGSDNGDNGEGPGHEPPRRSLLLRRRQGGSRERSIAQLQQAYEEVIDLVGTLKQHMEAQSQRSERLIEMMEGLPEALKSLPEANRTQTQTLQVIEGHLKQQNTQSEGLTQAIQGLAKAAGNQEHAMNLIQQQLDAGQESREQLHNNFNALGETLEQMTETHQSGTQLLNRLSDKHEQSDFQLQQLVARNQRQMTMMSVVSWSLAIVALAVAGAVAVWVGQQIGSADLSADATGGQQAGLVLAAQDEGSSSPELTGSSDDGASIAGAEALSGAGGAVDADDQSVSAEAEDVADSSDFSASSEASAVSGAFKGEDWLPAFDVRRTIAELLESLDTAKAYGEDAEAEALDEPVE